MAENPILNDRYRLIEQIGAGGMAVIYRAQDLELGRMVAVKVLRPSLVGDPEFLVRFKREARSAAQLSHPNIVTVHDVGQDGPNTHYIVMEYVAGQNLKQVIRSRGAFDVDAALNITTEVCKGVGYAHRAGLVHCDIKPQNILVTPDNMIKVTDFGIARALTERKEDEEEVWGSPHYFSPEQASGETPTPASDVYSIGIVLFELLTARLPFTGSGYSELAMAHLKQEPPTILDIDPSLPPELDRIIRKVLSKEPSARYRTADQLGRILRSYHEQGVQTTSSFVVRQSQILLEPDTPTPASSSPPPMGEETMPHQRLGRVSEDYTVPSLPPLDVDAAVERARASRQPVVPRGDVNHIAPEYTPPPPARSYRSREADEEELPAFDVENLVLGVLAAVAVLGLIPLWITVYFTFTR